MSTTCGRIPLGVVANKVDCSILVSEFKFQSSYLIPFRIDPPVIGMNTLISPAMGSVVLLLSFDTDGFDII